MHSDKENQLPQKDGLLQGGQQSPSDLESKRRELFSHCRSSGYGLGYLGKIRSQGNMRTATLPPLLAPDRA